MDCHSPIILPGRGKVPCGKCIPCLVRRQSDWVCRLLGENKQSTFAYFVTLTYDDNHIPRRLNEGIEVSVLCKRHIQLYLKRFRKRIDPLRVRYFCCGEYGSKTKRPHYHVIFFFRSDLTAKQQEEVTTAFDHCWSKGFVLTKPVNQNHFRYVAKYCSCSSELPKYYKHKDIRPFVLCSRRPAIGAGFMSPQMVNYYRETLNTVLRVNGVPYALPKYYRDRIFDDEMKAVIRERVDEYRYYKSLFQSKDAGAYPSLDALIHATNYSLEEKAEYDRRYRSQIDKSYVL